MSDLRFSLSEMHVNCFPKVVKRTILMMLVNSTEVGTLEHQCTFEHQCCTLKHQ